MTQGQPIPILFPAAMVILDKEVQGKGQDGSATSDISALPLRDLALLAPGSRSLSRACHRLFHFDFHAHPRMDTTLKTMFTSRQIRDV